ncbi:MAG: DapH/DapD/GlmU-related protein, partial [Verrucomicrobiota bacterium]|nr:DapH/DapD/GlmU-related protein [Verrucomicrobiota bacterium]
MESASNIPRAEALFDLGQTEHASLFDSLGQAWEVLPRIGDYLRDTLRAAQLGQAHAQAVIEGDVFVGEGTVIEAGALIRGPAWIGRNCRIGHGATLRGDVIVGDDCVVGHAVELKNAVLFNGCDVPHFNYVGDSVLGHRVHLGAGAMLSNYRLIRGNVNVRTASGSLDSGLAKFGALIGDRTEIGCNAVLNPGAIIGRDCLLYPNVTFTGVLPARRLVKNKTKLAV